MKTNHKHIFNHLKAMSFMALKIKSESLRFNWENNFYSITLKKHASCVSGFSLDTNPLGLKMITTSQQHRWSTLFRYKLETYIIKTRINFRVSDPMRSLLINSILIEVVPKHRGQIEYEGLIYSFPDNTFYYCFHYKC